MCRRVCRHVYRHVCAALWLQIVRWTDGGFGMACHNYDGDMLTDEVAQVPPALLPSVCARARVHTCACVHAKQRLRATAMDAKMALFVCWRRCPMGMVTLTKHRQTSPPDIAPTPSCPNALWLDPIMSRCIMARPIAVPKQSGTQAHRSIGFIASNLVPVHRHAYRHLCRHVHRHVHGRCIDTCRGAYIGICIDTHIVMCTGAPQSRIHHIQPHWQARRRHPHQRVRGRAPDLFSSWTCV